MMILIIFQKLLGLHENATFLEVTILETPNIILDLTFKKPIRDEIQNKAFYDWEG